MGFIVIDYNIVWLILISCGGAFRVQSFLVAMSLFDWPIRKNVSVVTLQHRNIHPNRRNPERIVSILAHLCRFQEHNVGQNICDKDGSTLRIWWAHIENNKSPKKINHTPILLDLMLHCCWALTPGYLHKSLTLASTQSAYLYPSKLDSLLNPNSLS